jgi:NAD+ synthetase
MKINNESDNTKLHPELLAILNKYRKLRNFDPEQYLMVKAKVISNYFEKWKLTGVVFGLSGGVDSAVVLAMFDYIARYKHNTKLQSVVPALMPYMTINEGVSGQSSGFLRAQNYVNSFDGEYVHPHFFDLTQPMLALLAEYEYDDFGKADAWARGQLATNLRTPAFYHLATLMSQKTGGLHVVSGTTNLDEAAYIGYFAKVGDCMVDIQPITDLHKSEVYTLARYLNVHEDILRVAPKGDVYDNRTDLEMIGTDYDFVELHHNMSKCPEQSEYLAQLSDEALHQYGRLEQRLDILHELNAHKYLRKPSYIDFDIMDTQAMEDQLTIYPDKVAIDTSKLNSFITKSFGTLTHQLIRQPFPHKQTCYNDGIISNADCNSLIQYFESVPLVPVSNNGYQAKIGSEVKNNNSAFRSTCFDTDLTRVLFSRLQGKINMYYEVDTDYANFLGMPAGQYLAVGLNPMLRYIKYFEGGALVPHYDTEHNFRDNKHITLQSAIFYLTSQHESGLTRFIKDKHEDHDYRNNKFLDWINLAKDQDVISSVLADAGACLTFDHRLLHDSSRFRSNQNAAKAVFRTDVIYRFIG